MAARKAKKRAKAKKAAHATVVTINPTNSLAVNW